ncbi:MAG: hypothetical protein GC164_02895 [Phycisphaera sp.]|nr:hypothetical protein [Phycisphaera sp.]
MTDSDFTHFAFLLDRTGSMDAIRSDAIGGFNTFVDDQKKAPTPAPGSGAPGSSDRTGQADLEANALTENVRQVWSAIKAGHDYAAPSPMMCSTYPFKGRCPAYG